MKHLVTLVSLCLILAVGFGGLNYYADQFVFEEIQKNMKTTVEGELSPSFFSTDFVVKDAKFNWDNKITVLGGQIKVDYGILTWFKKRCFDIRVTGEKVPVELFGALRSLSSDDSFVIDELVLDFAIDQGGIKELNTIRINSKELSLNISN